MINNNNNNDNNNTASITHTQEKCITSPHSNRSSSNFVSKSPEFYFSAIYLSKSYLSVLRTPLGVGLYEITEQLSFHT